MDRVGCYLSPREQHDEVAHHAISTEAEPT